jgi:hypothetical protein
VDGAGFTRINMSEQSATLLEASLRWIDQQLKSLNAEKVRLEFDLAQIKE